MQGMAKRTLWVGIATILLNSVTVFAAVDNRWAPADLTGTGREMVTLELAGQPKQTEPGIEPVAIPTPSAAKAGIALFAGAGCLLLLRKLRAAA